MKTFDDVLHEISGRRILVANRGIPARRIMRSIREQLMALPVLTVTDVDLTSPATSIAHELMLLGPNPRAYLDMATIVKKAKEMEITAIHPGWGFCAENEDFPLYCEKAGIVFIGPPREAMRLLGNKVEVRALASSLGIPVVPGSVGAVSPAEAKKVAEEIGFPVMLKAEGGGGGRGIYEIWRKEDLEAAFGKASHMAQSSFGNPNLFVEKFLTSIKHIEIQVIADKYGNVFAFDERDCTIQRNHQKLVEITPSPWPGMTEELRKRLKEYSITLVKAVGYYSLATVEFLVTPEGNPYLIEANTRLQVEHGITECRYGVDLVEEQIAIAFGAQLSFSEENTKPLQHAIQVRINCENPREQFEPNAGLITGYVSPGGQGVRLDSCLSGNYEFPSQYDSAGSLLIAYGRSWKKSLAVLRRALREYVITGVKTTISFLKLVVNNPGFISGQFDTNFVADTPELFNYRDEDPEALRLSQLVAEISALGYNPHVQLGEYRGYSDKRVGRFKPIFPDLPDNILSLDAIYPRTDRQEILDFVRDSKRVHFVDTTARDITQSNSSNRFRLAEDELIGPYLDNCGFFSMETGGGAHFHVAMMANMTYPFTEANKWNMFAPKTFKQILVRSTNLLGYKPQPRNIMQITGEMVCDYFDIVRCFDFLNHIENMLPIAEVILASRQTIFSPAVSLSFAPGFTVSHYMGVVDEILTMVAKICAQTKAQVSEIIILALKDMAGVCPPRFVSALVKEIRKTYPAMVIDYHRHYTDGLFVPSVGAAAQAGAHIIDTGMGPTVRWYGQGDILATAAYIEDELGLSTNIDREMIRSCNFLLKQIMPYYDRYVSPYFQGVDHDVVNHGMPGGATSSSQEGAMKQGYIHLLPYMLQFLAGTRKIVRYHDVTPGSQITWNTAFLAVTCAFKRGGKRAVEDLLSILDAVNNIPESELSDDLKKDRLLLYMDCNDAFRNLLLGRFGRMPLGFPANWVYESAFGADYKLAIQNRTTESPLVSLVDVKLKDEFKSLHLILNRTPTQEEFVMFLNHPGDAIKTIEFQEKYGDPNCLPLDVWFEGLEVGQDLQFRDSAEKLHRMTMIDISKPDATGYSTVRYTLDLDLFSFSVKIRESSILGESDSVEMADPENPLHIAAPCNGDLWVTYVEPGDFVETGQEVCNISVMKQEKAVLATESGIVSRVLKTACFAEDKKMVPVHEGELLIELALVTKTCKSCLRPVQIEDGNFCPYCGERI